MNDNIKRFAFYNIFFLCAFLGLFMVLNLKSFAYTTFTFDYNTGSYDNPTNVQCVCAGENDARYCLLASEKIDVFYQYTLYSNVNTTISYVEYVTVDGSTSSTNKYFSFSGSNNIYNRPIGRGWDLSGGIPIFYDIESVVNYLNNGVLPEQPFDETLKLDSFKISSWQVGTLQAAFRSKFEVTWTDSRIANVQVRVVGTANSPDTFEGNSSPFRQKFYAQNYVMKNGDVIHFTATPYKSNGEYGESLYYSLVYNDNLPSNWYRKLVNTPYNDTTITIPYTNVSGQPQSVTLPVDGITTNKVYKVNYNPVTYEYGDIYIYDIYYTPVIVYPDDTPEEEIDETQDTIINDYTTNNYNTINNITNYEFNIDFGDISNNDIQDSYDDVGNFLNGFGSFLAKIVNFFGVLFPFFPAGVSIVIITAFGIVALLLIVALVIKIVSAIKNFIF